MWCVCVYVCVSIEVIQRIIIIKYIIVNRHAKAVTIPATPVTTSHVMDGSSPSRRAPFPLTLCNVKRTRSPLPASTRYLGCRPLSSVIDLARAGATACAHYLGSFAKRFIVRAMHPIVFGTNKHATRTIVTTRNRNEKVAN
ncbi:hypothetical protein PUN28_004211 [Cardiocondyla obscurior]|uniref:Secreted protein n=1 Tax=Cardiocondyla obscurior TaxID=286306 RepID=A0AAW2GQ17_9HYME